MVQGKLLGLFPLSSDVAIVFPLAFEHFDGLDLCSTSLSGSGSQYFMPQHLLHSFWQGVFHC